MHIIYVYVSIIQSIFGSQIMNDRLKIRRKWIYKAKKPFLSEIWRFIVNLIKISLEL